MILKETSALSKERIKSLGKASHTDTFELTKLNNLSISQNLEACFASIGGEERSRLSRRAYYS